MMFLVAPGAQLGDSLSSWCLSGGLDSIQRLAEFHLLVREAPACQLVAEQRKVNTVLDDVLGSFHSHFVSIGVDYLLLLCLCFGPLIFLLSK